MNKLTDQQLLRDYAEYRSEAAFAELVRRHVDLVYSAALRVALRILNKSGSAAVVSLGAEVAKHVAIFFLKLLPFPGQRHSLEDVGTGRQRFVEGIRRARL